MAKSIVTVDTNSCKGCELCVSVCPKHVLAIDKTEFNARGVFPASVANADGCIGCASCAIMCPDGAITVIREVE